MPSLMNDSDHDYSLRAANRLDSGSSTVVEAFTVSPMVLEGANTIWEEISRPDSSATCFTKSST